MPLRPARPDDPAAPLAEGGHAPARWVTFSNSILLLVGGISLLFFVYSVANHKSDLPLRLAPALLGMAAPLLLFLRQSIRLTAAGIFAGLAVGLYAAQFLSVFLIDPDRPTSQAVQKVAHETGIPYDGKSLLQEINKFRGRGVTAYPPYYPYHLLDAPLKLNGQPVLPLSSVSHAFTVCCNEGGQYLTYTTDEHGFPNPRGSWSDLSPADIAFIGASSAVGEAVPPADNLLAQLSARYGRTVSLGAGGNGPLLELASIKEYLPVLKPRRVLWMFSESNTPAYLGEEGKSTLLRRYLDDPSFSQGLFEKQPELDKIIAEYFDKGMREEGVVESPMTALKSFLLLRNLRMALYSDVAARKGPAPYQFNTDLYEQVLRSGQKTIDTWGGRIVIVYFPDSSRYAGICNYSPALRAIYDRTHDSVWRVAGKLGLPMIDLSKAFPDVPASESALNTPYFYPFPAHYTAAGYHRAGKAILDALEAPPR